MYDFSIDVQGENEDEPERSENACKATLTESAFSRNEISGEAKLDLFVTLPELPNKSISESKNDNNLNFNDTYVITSLRHKGEVKFHGTAIDDLMIKSSLKSGLEKQNAIPLMKEKTLKLNRKKLRESTKGEKWYNLPATEVTEEVKNDLQILQMRSVLDKNHFYKKNDVKNICKYFQFGTIVENSADFYSGRIVKSKRKKSLVDELLADAECKSYQKKKYKEIMDINRRKHCLKKQSQSKKNKLNKKKQKIN